ncbi:MAG: MBL fold metallo-hydrolase [Ardenticatenia bacterium]|nr:MBL fold metallo-hydrolase [Ardenticatenia bacterium]
MKLTYYGYNAFVIEGEGKTIILDPGQNLHWRRLNSLIPRQLWVQADLILVTHGDADHAEYVPQVARASSAPIVCGPALAGKWRRKGLTVVPVAPGETVEVAGVQVQGVPAQHGGPTLTLFGHTFTFKPRFVGVGAVGLLFTLEGRWLLALGDTVLLEDAWRGLRPEVLMVPIGGVMTMDVDEALRAVAVIEPEVVIPVHYNWDVLFYHRPADVERFAAEVRAGGRRCCPLKPGESAEV